MRGPGFGKFKLFEKENQIPKVKKKKSVSRPKEQHRKRNRSGCFTCRKRKIKCSGLRPYCENCIKSSYLCLWPTGEESLSHQNDFIIRKCQYINKNGKITVHNHFHEIFESREDELFRKVLVEINLSALDTVSPKERNSLLDSAFIKGFMTDISPQLAHINLQPGAVFIPLGKGNEILQELFHSCGASFLYRKTQNEKMRSLSQAKFDNSMEALLQRVSLGSFFQNEIGMLAHCLLTYLKLKFVYEGQRIHTLSMLAAIESMKFWVIQKQGGEMNFENGSIVTDILRIEHATLTETMLINLINQLKFYTSNRLLCLDDGDPVIVSPTERTILESFVYNYANSIFRCDRNLKAYMTSPFIIFDSLRPYLTNPIYQCAVPWMNHPIVGAAFPLIELQAKLCWFGLTDGRVSDEDKAVILQIRNTVDSFERPSLPVGVLEQEPPNIQSKLLESTYGAVILAKALYVYATKLLYPDIPMEVELVQSSVKDAYEAFYQISPQSQIHVVLLFSMAVIGCSTVNTSQKAYMLHKVETLKEVFKVYSLTTLAPLFDAAWKANGYGLNRGWDVLFDPECLNSVVF
ncbi:hypothetical protein CANINC_004006 [Pichia inconspicua]|uniref:Zn(2)-C6 fungal-type domain-containing protein n=1 Tax=Pichia inconspicua TaxID=52247 RepID=A0A4T0WXQ5_9ASCO|nr:hypothetical protein CANINC_004006 [[Candida] inconspicua]